MIDLQIVYDKFLSKTNVDYTGLEAVIFEFMKTGIVYCKRNVPFSYDYVLTDAVNFEGYFTENLSDEAIEYLALHMIWSEAVRERGRVLNKREEIGTSAFNRKEKNRDLLKGKIEGQEQAFLDLVRFQEGLYYM